jgi:hypothetical protein
MISLSSLTRSAKLSLVVEILEGMRSAGYEDTITNSCLITHSTEDLDYYLVNYGESYLKTEFAD